MDTLKPERIDYLERLVSGVLDMIKENGVEYIDGEECLRATWLDADLLCHVIKEEVLPVLKRTSEWVSVDDRLPEDGEEIFVFTGKEVAIDLYEDETFQYDNWAEHMNIAGGNCRTVTHWMPLPLPPKEDE